MKAQTILAAFAVAVLAAPGSGYAQVEIGSLKAEAIDMPQVILVVPGLSGEHSARVIAPRNFAEQLRRGTLRQLELEVAPGPLNDALARSHRTRGRLSTVGVKAKEETGDYLVVTLKDARVITYSLTAATSSEAGKLAPVKVQFQWGSMSTAPAAEKSEPIGIIELVATKGPAQATQSGDGFADLIVGAQPARLVSPGSLQSLTTGAAQNQPIAIEVQRGSPLERLLRSSLTGKKVIPKLILELSAPGAAARGTRIVATLSNARVAASKRGNTVGMEVISLSYENVTFD